MSQAANGHRPGRVVVIRHHAEDSPGFVAEAFTALGARVTTHLFPGDGPLPGLDGAGHVVVLGAIPSVYDDGEPSAWIAAEVEWLREADAAGVPVLGICFGAQALCAALGGRVIPAPRKEIGWRMIEPADPEAIPPGPWLQFHGDQCLPPRQAVILARNEVCVQAYSIGPHLGVQFHPEVDGQQLALWIASGGREEAVRAGQDPDELVAQAYAQEPAARERAGRLVATALRIAGRRQVTPRLAGEPAR